MDGPGTENALNSVVVLSLVYVGQAYTSTDFDVEGALSGVSWINMGHLKAQLSFGDPDRTCRTFFARLQDE